MLGEDIFRLVRSAVMLVVKGFDVAVGDKPAQAEIQFVHSEDRMIEGVSVPNDVRKIAALGLPADGDQHPLMEISTHMSECWK